MDKFIFSVIVGLIGGTLSWWVIGMIIEESERMKRDPKGTSRRLWLICFVSLTLIMLLFGFK